MFVLVELKDTVRIPPTGFKYKLNDVIAEELNQKLANKVNNLFIIEMDLLLSIKIIFNIVIKGLQRCRSVHCVIRYYQDRRVIHFPRRRSVPHKSNISIYCISSMDGGNINRKDPFL